MLKNIPKILPPELVKILLEMGHGDNLVIADANFPAASNATRVIYAPGVDAVAMMDAILTLMPLDAFVESPAFLMAVNPGHDYTPTIWEDFKQTIYKHNGETNIKYIDRFEFYDQAKKAYVIISTGEERFYGCAILKKGVLAPGESI